MGEWARILNVDVDWEIVKLTLASNQTDVFAKSFVPQPSLQHEKQTVLIAIVCRCISVFLDDLGDLPRSPFLLPPHPHSPIPVR